MTGRLLARRIDQRASVHDEIHSLRSTLIVFPKPLVSSAVKREVNRGPHSLGRNTPPDPTSGSVCNPSCGYRATQSRVEAKWSGMIRAILADDEVLARQKLRRLLRDEREVDVVGECASALETIELVRVTKAELLFLDIKMPGMDGFDVIGALSSDRAVPMPAIVFTTAYDRYALRAFEVHAVDYLLKPFTPERLHSAIQRVRERALTRNSASDSNGENSPDPSARIVFKSRGRILFLPVANIRWIGAEENYVRLCTGAETHLLRETMSHLESRLDQQQFLRVHRSFIVNLNFVKEVRTELDGESVVVMTDGHKIAMSRGYRSRILESLRQ